jgi:hypothetical protein
MYKNNIQGNKICKNYIKILKYFHELKYVEYL